MHFFGTPASALGGVDLSCELGAGAMYRFLGLFLFLVGMVGGWWVGRPQAPAMEESTTVEEISAALAWQLYRAEAARAQICEGDIHPHPAWVALALAASTLTLLTFTSNQPRRAWGIALGLQASNSSVAVPW